MATCVYIAQSWTFAALLEEMVYRGWLTLRLAECTQFSRASWGIATLGAAALFGVAHLYQGVSGVATNVVVGLILGWLYLAMGRNLWASIVAHGVMNTAGFVLMYLGLYPGSNARVTHFATILGHGQSAPKSRG